jgi:sugar phosphate isomerase/epimerase
MDRRAFLVASGLLALGPRLAAQAPAGPGKFRVGVTDWNLRLEGNPASASLAKACGFDGVQVSLSNRPSGTDWVGPAVLDQMVAASKTHGVALTSVCLNILHRNYLKSDALGIQRVSDSIGMARRVGVQVVLLPFFGAGALKTTAEMDYVGDLLRELGPQAEKAGIVLGLEDTISARDNARIMERSQSAAVKTYYDVGNSIKQGFDIIEEIRWLGAARICEVHLKDNPHYLGEGPINFPAVIDALGDIGFDKWAVLETESPSKDVQADMTRNLGYVRGLVTARS